MFSTQCFTRSGSNEEAEYIDCTIQMHSKFPTHNQIIEFAKNPGNIYSNKTNIESNTMKT